MQNHDATRAISENSPDHQIPLWDPDMNRSSTEPWCLSGIAHTSTKQEKSQESWLLHIRLCLIVAIPHKCHHPPKMIVLHQELVHFPAGDPSFPASTESSVPSAISSPRSPYPQKAPGLRFLGSHFWNKNCKRTCLARKSPCVRGKSCMNGQNSCCKAIRSAALLIFWTAMYQSITSTSSYSWWTGENGMRKYWKVLQDQVKFSESKHCMSCEATNHSTTP